MPSASTVQEPQAPTPQPSRVLVIPTWPRNASSSRVVSSTGTLWATPLTLRVISLIVVLR